MLSDDMFRDIELEPPRGWVDRSMLAYAAPLAPGQKLAPNIVVTRDARLEEKPGQPETFESYVKRQCAELGARLGGLHVERQQSGSVNGITAHDMLFTWQSAHGSLRQRTVFLQGPGTLVLTFAATAAKGEYEAYREQFDRVLASLRLGTSQTGSGDSA